MNDTRDTSANENSVTSEFTTRRKKRKKQKKVERTWKSGGLRANNLGTNPVLRENRSRENRLHVIRNDPFYMVDGVEIEEQMINENINTNSGVLEMDKLKYLQ